MGIFDEKRPTIFLNIDGVLHPFGALLLNDGTVRMRDGRHTLFQWAEPLVQIVGEYNAELVLRTSWTSQLPLYRVLSLMPSTLAHAVAGVTQPIAISRTDRTQCRSRYSVIREYVEWHALTKWVAIDDVDDGWPESEQEKLVLCEDGTGLSRLLTELELREKLQQLSR
ncbi:hypothetical protein WS62_29500 [Burkholderia sp. ABCPW 14]|uniref:HAD domain-containing protein n=1 Tax=Burkholderia TaxID=32008 RepID=UPI00075763F1|nr:MULTISPECIES: HAD domain-containing protein [Burkholderia]AOJ81815.1 hypothetical protein WS86_15160 [Burkholderia savannae]KVD78101.1 hypothetical protein WS62_29500 [Burkholderia sp. ABCPW 14]